MATPFPPPRALQTGADFGQRQVGFAPDKAKKVIGVRLYATRALVAAHRQPRVVPRSRNAAIHRIALAKLTPNRRAVARQLMPCSEIAETTLLRKSKDNGPIPRRPQPAQNKNQISSDSQSPSRFNLLGCRSKCPSAN